MGGVSTAAALTAWARGQRAPGVTWVTPRPISGHDRLSNARAR